MSDTSFSKPSHTNGPVIKIFDLGTSTSTGSQPGPYAEAVVPLGWDPVGLDFVKLKVDSLGQLFTVGGTSTGGGGGQQYAELSTVGTTGTGNLILGHDTGGIARVPSVTSLTSSTAMSVMIVDSTGGQITSFGTSTTTVVQGTASNLNATVAGTVTTIPSGTQVVSGTVTVNGTDTTTIAGGTVAVTQVTSPWVVGGTTTTVPSGTQSTQPLRTLDFNGSATITSTVNISNFTFQACEVVLISITGSFTGQISFAGFYSNNQVGVSLPVYDITGALVSATGTITSAGSINNAYIVLAGGIGLLQANPVSWASGTGIIQLEASQAGRAFINIPSGVQTVSVTTNTSVGALVYTNIALADTGTAIKASSGVLYGYDVSCIGVSGSAGAGVVKLYNKSTIPTSTDTPIITIPLNTPANNTGRSVFGLNPPMLFSSGIGIRASQLIVTTDTTAPSGTVVVNILYA